METMNYSEFQKPPFLLQQFLETDVQRVLDIHAAGLQKLEEAAQRFFIDLWIDTAAGAQLDVLGKHLVVDREGRNDDSFRTVLKLKAFINVGGGTPETIIETVRKVYNATVIHYIPDYPAGIIIQQNGQIGLYIDSFIETDSGDLMVTNLGDSLVFSEPDSITENLLEAITPSGVSLTITTI